MTFRSSILIGSLAMGILLLGCDNTTVGRPLFGAGGIPSLGGDLGFGGDTSGAGGGIAGAGGSDIGGSQAGGATVATGGIAGIGGSMGGVPTGGQTGLLVPATPAIALGSNHTCALASDGTVKCWGSNFSGQIGDGTTTSAYLAPTAVTGLSNVTQLALGGGHTCVLLADGTVKCWGANPTGELGYPTTAKCTDPGDSTATVDCSRTPTLVPGLAGVAQIDVAGEEQSLETSGHSCALLADSSVKCWGANDNGQLGDGTNINRPSPTAVSGLTNVRQIAVGKNHSCALMKDSTVKCWGINGNGQLGDGTNLPRLVPTPVAGLAGVTSIAVGGLHTCAVLSDATMKCWGGNAYGELGDGTIVDRNIPTVVTGLAGVSSVSLGNEHSCVLLTNGILQCCGRNDLGQVGDGTTSAPKSFIPISGLTGAVQIALGGAHSGARMKDGSMKCWGSNSSGGLGDGTRLSQSTPTTVLGIGPGGQVDAGGQGGAGGTAGSDGGVDARAGTAGASGNDAGPVGGSSKGGTAGSDAGGGATAGASGRDAAVDVADAPASDAGDAPASYVSDGGVSDADDGSVSDADDGSVSDADGGATVCNNIDITLAPAVTPVVLAATAPPSPTGGTYNGGIYYLTSSTIYVLDSPAPTVTPLQEIMVGTCSGGICTIQTAIKRGSEAVQRLTLSGAVSTGTTVGGTMTCPAGGAGGFAYTSTGNTLMIFTYSDNGGVTVTTFTKQAAAG
jgi:alpha-tubulin suppressor-like RCC1 family protein